MRKLPKTTNQILPTRAEMTTTQANSTTTIVHSTRAVDPEHPHLLVNKVTEKLEVAEDAHQADGDDRCRPNRSTIVGNDSSKKYSFIGNFDTLEPSYTLHVNSHTTNIRFQNQNIKSCKDFTAGSPESILTN